MPVRVTPAFRTSATNATTPWSFSAGRKPSLRKRPPPGGVALVPAMSMLVSLEAGRKRIELPERYARSRPRLRSSAVKRAAGYAWTTRGTTPASRARKIPASPDGELSVATNATSPPSPITGSDTRLNEPARPGGSESPVFATIEGWPPSFTHDGARRAEERDPRGRCGHAAKSVQPEAVARGIAGPEEDPGGPAHRQARREKRQDHEPAHGVTQDAPPRRRSPRSPACSQSRRPAPSARSLRPAPRPRRRGAGSRRSPRPPPARPAVPPR